MKEFFNFEGIMLKLEGAIVRKRYDLERPIGVRVHLTGDQEMGMETKSYRGVVRNVRSVRHMI